jgi:hypothetical protein
MWGTSSIAPRCQTEKKMCVDMLRAVHTALCLLLCTQLASKSTITGSGWVTVRSTLTIPRSVHTALLMCFVWISEQTAIISLYNINWLVCITETECVYCAVRTGYLNVIQLDLISQRLIDFQSKITSDLIYGKLPWKINKFFVLYSDENKGISCRGVRSKFRTRQSLQTGK